MTIILLAQTMFGSLVVFRILRGFRTRALISSTTLTKIGTGFAALISIGGVFLHSRPKFMPLFIVCAALSLILLLKVREMRRISLLQEEFPRFLDRWLLNLRTGRASASARDQALQSGEEQFKILVKPLFSAEDSGSAHLFLAPRVRLELHAIQSEAHNSATRLQNLRESTARESDFRRKSGQALRQASIQSSILLLMHLALCGFIGARSGWWSNADLILFATLLTLMGMLLLRLIARRIRWTF